LEKTLRANLRARSAELMSLWDTVNDHWGYEDPVYRFYHQSFKVFRMQQSTQKMVAVLEALVPGRELHPWFRAIIADGTGKVFSPQENQRWLEVTRPIVEAFQHARYFLDMACRYAEAPEEQPCPSGWAALLHLYRLW
jgi:hypothetical protein